MPSEVSIAKPLSGVEALESLVYALRFRLSTDDRFTSNMAYDGFHATIEVKFFPQHSFIPPVHSILNVDEGETDDLDSTSATFNLVLPIRPPNLVREEAELPTPVLVTDNQGRSSEKWIARGERPTSKPRAPKQHGKQHG